MELSAGRRELRVAALIGVALAIVLVTGVVYLRPSFPAPAAVVTPPPGGPSVSSAFFADADHGVVTAAANPPASPLATLFLTRDGGSTWSRQLGSQPSMILSSPWFGSRFLVVASSRAGAGVRVSGDGGRTWHTLLPPSALQPNVAYGAVTGPVLLSATDGWWMTPPAPGDPDTVQLWRTMDGSTWTRLPAAGIPSKGFKGQLWFADDRHGLLLVSDPPASVSVLTTDDGGATWGERARFGPPFLGAYTVGAAVMAHGDRLVLCLVTLPNPPRSGPADPFLLSPGLYTATSTGGGATWGQLVAGPGFSSATLPLFDDRGRMLLLSDRRLWISDTYGAVWHARLVALPAGVRVLTLNSAVRGALFAIGVESKPAPSARDGAFPPTVLLKSRDGGVHWEQLVLPALAS